MIKPNYLKEGDKVAIVCTARKFSKEEAIPAMELLASWGLVPVLGETIGLDEHQLGGTDDERIADFNKQLRDPSIKAIWCARGGYGTVRIIDHIDFEVLLANPKWIIGFSDVTVLHSHIHNLGVETIHGIMAFSVPKATEDSKESLRKMLYGEKVSYDVDANNNNIEGAVEGVLVGGNLSILYSLLGSVSSIKTEGKILYIEDLDEYFYHLDRMMHNMDRNGMLSGIRGLIVGGMTDMHDNSIPFGYDAIQIIKSVCAQYSFPIMFDMPSGHGQENVALPFGGKVRMTITAEGAKLIQL
ncbi:S66 peptidase family protein [Myroides pelagicus]|uniref:LD-carboxypeptidase n=1 Tax=Myroides pelagicus TaxID=270914 RepID=A0A7K1GN84_9FLAO|nr:LD-carboxypeptidase [Myroides pelagicus]MTH29664.1 LD-carboxypeptidase [Myroides pelagicus]